MVSLLSYPCYNLPPDGGDKLNFGRIKAGVDLTGVNNLKLLELGGEPPFE